jgi:hypothetical protein
VGVVNGSGVQRKVVVVVVVVVAAAAVIGNVAARCM